MDTMRRPPYDPTVAAALEVMAAQPQLPVTPESIPVRREHAGRFAEDLDRFGLDRRDVTIAGYQGDEIVVTVFSKSGRTEAGPGIFHVHGGGMIAGDRFTGMSLVLPFVVEHDAAAVTVEYRRAPEFPDPYPVEDAFAALRWTAENAGELGIDPGRILIVGASAGGGISAGTVLMSRDRGGPHPLGQMLICPMLDDRDESISTLQFSGLGLHTREENRLGWDALLGDRRGGGDVSIYAAPARASDLSRLPPTFIDVGSAEVFRDEDVAYATQIWADGGEAELHVWPGGTHGWEAFAQGTRMAEQAAEARAEWVRRLFDRAAGVAEEADV